MLVVFALALGLAAQTVVLPGGLLLPGIVLYTLAGTLFVKSLPAVPTTQEEVAPLAGSNRARPAFFLAVAAVLTNAVSLAMFAARPERNAGDGWPAYFLSLTLLFAAALAYDCPSLGRRSVGRFCHRYRHEGLVLLALTAAALAVRLYRLDELPFGIWIDESAQAVVAGEMLADERLRPIIVYILDADVTVAPYVVAGAFALWGDNVFAMRLPFALIGTLMVPAFYLLARTFFAFPVAALATALVAFSRWHLTFSRISMVPVATPLLAALSVFCLVRGYRSGRLFWYVCSGFALAVGLWFYAASRFVVVVLALYLGVLLLRKRTSRRALLVGTMVLGLSMMLVYSPLPLYLAKHPTDAMKRIEDTLVTRGKAPADAALALANNTAKHLLAYHYRGDPNGRHNIPGAPLLDPISGVLAALGLAATVLQRGPRRLLLLTWLLVPLLGGIVTLEWEAPHASRTFGSFPAVFLLAATAVDKIRHLALHAWPAPSRPLLLALAAAAAIAVAWLNGEPYFRSQTESFAVWSSHSTAETLAALEIKRLSNRTDLRVAGAFYRHPTVTYLAPAVRSYSVIRDETLLVVADGRDTTYLLDSSMRGQYEQLRAHFPTGKYTELIHPATGTPVAFKVQLTAADVAAARGLTASVSKADSGVTAELPAETLAIDWTKESQLAPPFRATWRGTLLAPLEGRYLLGMQSPGAFEVLVDGTVVVAGQGRGEQEVTLAAGPHSLAVAATVAEARGVSRLYWRRPDGVTETVPRSALLRSAPPLGEVALEQSLRLRDDPSLAMTLQRLELTPLPNGALADPSGRVYDRLVWLAAGDGRRPLGALQKLEPVPMLANGMRLLGYAASKRAAPGETVSLSLVWALPQASPRRVDKEFNLFVHLSDSYGRQLAVQDSELHSYRSWREQDLLLSQHQVKVPPQQGPGLLWFDIGAYGRFDREAVPWWDGQGSVVGGAIRVGPTRLHLAALRVPAQPAGYTYGGRLDLWGYDLPEGNLLAGQPLEVSLWWRARETLTDRYVISVQLLDAAGRLVAQHDAEPVDGAYPTPYWEVGEAVVDRHTVSLPSQLASGAYSLVAVVYTRQGNVRLPVALPDGTALGDAATLATLQSGR